MEKTYTRASNTQTEMITRVDGEVVDVLLKFEAMDEGLRTLASRVDEDLLTQGA